MYFRVCFSNFFILSLSHLNCGPPSETPLSSSIPPMDEYLHILPVSVQKVDRALAVKKWREKYCQLSREDTILWLDEIVKR